MNEQQIKDRLVALASELVEKGYERPEVTLLVKCDGRVDTLIQGRTKDNDCNLCESTRGDTIAGALAEAGVLVAGLGAVDEFYKKKAVEQFGMSIDALRASGIDADFVDPLSDALKAMSENLLTDQRATA